MLSFSQFSLLMESFKDAKTKWVNQGVTPETVDKIINLFKQLKDQNIIIDKDKKDIGFWMGKSFNDFSEFIQNVNNARMKKKTESDKAGDIVRVFENEWVLVVVPLTFEASQKYGAHTQWCITGYSDYYWKEYINTNGLTPYYIIFKTAADINKYSYNLDKVAVMVDEDENIRNIYDDSDHEITNDHFRPTEEDEDEDGNMVEVDGESMNITDIFDIYNIPWQNFNSKIIEVESDDGLSLEHIDDFFPIDETNVDGYTDLMNYYDESQFPEDQRIHVNDLEDFIKDRFNQDCVEGGRREISPDFIHLLSNQIHRSILYPESLHIKQFIQNVNEFIENIEVEYTTIYELAA